jgi:hypothetical protein
MDLFCTELGIRFRFDKSRNFGGGVGVKVPNPSPLGTPLVVGRNLLRISVAKMRPTYVAVSRKK